MTGGKKRKQHLGWKKICNTFMCFPEKKEMLVLPRDFNWWIKLHVDFRPVRLPPPSPSSFHDVLVYQSISEDVFVEELIGEEHQQRGDGLKQDAVSDVTAKDTERTELEWLN